MMLIEAPEKIEPSLSNPSSATNTAGPLKKNVSGPNQTSNGVFRENPESPGTESFPNISSQNTVDPGKYSGTDQKQTHTLTTTAKPGQDSTVPSPAPNISTGLPQNKEQAPVQAPPVVSESSPGAIPPVIIGDPANHPESAPPIHQEEDQPPVITQKKEPSVPDFQPIAAESPYFDGNDSQTVAIPFYRNRVILILSGVFISLLMFILIAALFSGGRSRQNAGIPDSENNQSLLEDVMSDRPEDGTNSPNPSEETTNAKTSSTQEEPDILSNAENQDLSPLIEPGIQLEADTETVLTTSGEVISRANATTDTDDTGTAPDTENTLDTESESDAHGEADGSTENADTENPDETQKTDDKTPEISDTPDNPEIARKTPDNEPEDEETLTAADFEISTRETVSTIQKSVSAINRKERKIDIDKQLDLPIKSISFPQTLPVQALETLAEISDIPISFDLTVLPVLRQSTETPVDLKMENTTVGGVLEKIAELLHWTILKQEQKILLSISAENATEYRESVFDLSDLVAIPKTENGETTDQTKVTDNQTAKAKNDSVKTVPGTLEILSEEITVDQIAEMIPKFISPDSWQPDGQGSIRIQENNLVVSQTRNNLWQTAIFLDQIRGLRHLDGQSKIPTEQLIPEVLGWEKLSQPMTLNFLEPIPLQEALMLIGNSQKLQILIDDAALADAGVGRETLATVHVNNGTVDRVLMELLSPFNITYFILDENSILVTSREEAEKYQTVEIHLFANPENGYDVQKIPELIEQMKGSITDSHWDNLSQGYLLVDPVSCCLLIRQTQPVQRSLRLWLKNRLEKNNEQPHSPGKSGTGPSQETRSATQKNQEKTSDPPSQKNK